MNVISKLRRDIIENGSVTLDIDEFNQLQKEWILRTMDKQASKALATDFYCWWRDQKGTSAEQGFDEWWELQR